MLISGDQYVGGTLNVTGNADFNGNITCDTSITIDSTTISAAEIGVLDGVSAGTAAASKAVVLDGSKNIATIGTIGCGAITSTGNSSYGTLTGGALSSSATLQAVGNTILGGNLNLSGTFTHAGAYSPTNISSSGTLQIVGATILGSTLNVTGAATMAGKVSVDNEISGSGTLQAAGATTLGSTLSVSGTVSVAGDIDHAGDSDTYLRFEPNLVNLVAGGKSAIKLETSAGKIQLNNSNDNLDVQIMADDGEVILHTDAGTNRVGIGTSSPSDELHVSGATAAIVIGSNAASIASLQLKQGGTTYGRLQIGGGGVFNIENLVADEDMVFKVNDGGSTRTALTLDSSVSEVIVNNGADSLVDFRVESVNNTHMLFVDGSADKVGINSSAPTHTLTVAGTISGSGTLHTVGAATFGATLATTGSITATGAVSGAAATFTTIAGTSLALQSGGITAAGAIAGATTVSGAASTFTTLAGTSLALQSGGITAAGSIAGATTIAGTSISGSGKLQMVDDTILGAALHVSGNVGLQMSSPKVALDVHHNPTGLSDNTGGGDVAVWGTEDGSDTLAAGKLMCLNTSGVWVYADADAVATSGGVLLAIALGTSISDGLLLRGYFDATTIQGTFAQGAVCYVSENAGVIDFTRPSAGGDVVRVVGYGTNTANVIYFNPSGDWIEL